MKTLKSVVAGMALLFSASIFSTADAQKTATLTDPEIASIAVTANQIDVDYAAIALKKSKNKEIRNFATTMKNDHTAVIKMAVDLAKKLKVTPKTNATTKSLLEGSVKMKKELNAKSGKAFDKAYIDNEVSYHEAVVKTVEETLIPETKNAELKALLVKVLPTLKMHTEHALKVQKDLK